MTVSDVEQPPTRLDPGALAALEDQRDFLLASLEDLERERAAGDVDEHDYLALRDDYTARAAAVLRSIEAGRRRAPRRSRRRLQGRTVVAIAGVLAFSVLAGLLVAQAAGRRDAGDTLTGGTRQSVTEKLNEAGRRGAEGDLQGAIGVYDEVLEVQPENVEALTYRGWLLTLSGESEEGLTSLLAAATADPGYPDVHAFLAVVFFRNGLVDQAARALDRFEALDPPASIRQLTEGLREEIDEARSASTTTTSSSTTP